MYFRHLATKTSSLVYKRSNNELTLSYNEKQTACSDVTRTILMPGATQWSHTDKLQTQ